jgi:ACS family hexuronate transporter-like MFS transporter
MMLVSFVSYVDRTTLALLAPTILADLRLSAEQYGWIISAFSLCYTASNPAWGAALDRVGLRAGMAVAVALWTAASASHALAGGMLGLACARALLGLGEGATFPGGLRAATQTLPEHLRSRGVAIAYGGGSLGAVLTPVLVTPVALAYGWRGAFVATGLLGAGWIALWLAVAPSADRGVPPRAHATGTRTTERAARAAPFVDARLAAFLCLYALGGLPLGFVIYGAPLYLARALGQSQHALGSLLWIPPVGWELGYLVTGWVVDRRARDADGGRTVVSPGLLCGVAFVGIPLAVVPLLPGVALPLVAFFLATLAAGSFIILALAYATRELGVGRAGLLAGLGAGTWSALVAISMPPFGRLFDRGRFDAAFLVAGLAQTAGVVLWVGLARTRGQGRPSPIARP